MESGRRALVYRREDNGGGDVLKGSDEADDTDDEELVEVGVGVVKCEWDSRRKGVTRWRCIHRAG